MKKLGFILLGLAMALTAMAQRSGDVVILYENDVHCAVKGYPVLAGLRDSLQRKGCAVAVVSSGDFSFGGPMGAASKGEFIIRMMNTVGYDAAALGNHEFDYGMVNLRRLEEMVNTPLLSCNLRLNEEPMAHPFSPYVIRRYNGIDIAFIGITTPTAITTSSPASFKDDQGNYIYNLCANDLAVVVQRSVDEARAAGASVVVLLSHIGDSDGTPTSGQLAAQLTGVDLILDAHDHHVLPGTKVTDKEGKQLLISSTGTQFEYIGMAVLPTSTYEQVGRQNLTTKLCKVEDLRKAGCVNKVVMDTLQVINDLFNAMGNNVVATTEFNLVATENTIRVCRLRETNLGDLIADAFRWGLKADIGWVNSGGIRDDVPVGPITHNKLFAVCPYDNKISLVRVKGIDILNALECAVRDYPLAEGGFPQVSGLSFTFDPAVTPSCEFDKDGQFIGVKGAYRVSNVKVGNKPLDPEDTYTIASSDYVLFGGGNGLQFPSKVKITTYPGSDLQLLEEYLQQELHGTIGAPYGGTQGRINMK